MGSECKDVIGCMTIVSEGHKKRDAGKVHPFLQENGEWAMQDSNLRPPAPEAGALSV